MRALLIESHPLLRIALLSLLEGMTGIDQAIAVDPDDIDRYDASDRVVDLIVFGMPADREVGWRLLGRVRNVWRAQHVLLMADGAPLKKLDGDLAEGVVGCLPKSAPLPVLEATLKLIAGGYLVNGRSFQPAPLHLDVIVLPGRSSSVASLPGVPLANQQFDYQEAHVLGLTPRQYEVLVLMGRGHPVKIISRLLNIEPPTVKSHAQAVYKQLGVRGKGEAVYKALQRGARLWWGGDDGDARFGTGSSFSPPEDSRADSPLTLDEVE